MMKQLAVLLLAGIAMVTCSVEQDYKSEAPKSGYQKGPYYGAYAYGVGYPYGFGYPGAVRNDHRQLEVNAIADHIGAGTGTGAVEGVPGSNHHGYYRTYGFGYGYPYGGYPYYHGAYAPIVPVAAPVKSVKGH